jgi:hypothetical protein
MKPKLGTTAKGVHDCVVTFRNVHWFKGKLSITIQPRLPHLWKNPLLWRNFGESLDSRKQGKMRRQLTRTFQNVVSSKALSRAVAGCARSKKQP